MSILLALLKRLSSSGLILTAAIGSIVLGPVALAADSLICASYPVWLFTRYLNDGRDLYQVELLTNPATGCPHEFTPSNEDMERLSQTKVLIKNGLGLESYLDLALKAARSDVLVIDASAGVPTLPVTWGRVDFDGTLAQEAAGLDAAMVSNPHIFMSPQLSIAMVANIADGLSKIDPGGAEHYARRLAEWELEVRSLIEDVDRFRETHRGFKLITSHGFMDYLAQDLGLTILADVSPLGTEAPPTARRLVGLSRLISQERVSAIVLDKETNPAAAQTLGQEAGIKAVVLDTATSGDYDPPMDFYQQVLRENIDLLNEILPANARPPSPPPKPAPQPPNPKPIEPPVFE